jgi:hypothetical protein
MLKRMLRIFPSCSLSHYLVLGWTGLALAGHAQAQDWNPGKDLNASLKEVTSGRFQLSFEERVRLETRTGNNFGNSPNLENPLIRTRIGASLLLTDWLKVSAMGQDSRAPEYGVPAPNTARDTMDLHEAYIELFPASKAFFGATFGRQMVSYGEGRIIGVPQWSNVSRTYDTARVHFLLPAARIEFLIVSQVKILPDAYNLPELGDRVWGTYNALPKLIRKGIVEAYYLRHDQNRPGGFTQAGRLGINTFGGRAAGPLPAGLKYSLEGVAQSGHTGVLTHRGYAWFSNLSRTVNASRPLDLSIEYKYASGNSGEDKTRETTFDQLYAANHDKFGHEDLFGWRNIRNLRSLEVFHLSKKIAINAMYDNWWLADAHDALYNGSGKSIVARAKGTAGTHVGQELDEFATYQSNGWQFGLGFGHLFSGEFLKNTTPGVNTRYLYIFQSFSF